MDTFVRQYKSFNVNVMVGVGDGLVAPVVRDVGGRGLKAISDDVRALAQAAQAQELEPHQVSDTRLTCPRDPSVFLCFRIALFTRPRCDLVSGDSQETCHCSGVEATRRAFPSLITSVNKCPLLCCALG